MVKEINIAEILKDKPKGTKLYSSIFGEVTLYKIYKELDTNFLFLKDKDGDMVFFEHDGKYNVNGECVLFPSKEKRYWSKFAWKKGDVLVSNDSDSHIIFKGFSKDDYTTFEGKHWISVSKKRHISRLNMQNTQDYHIEDDKDAAQAYINTIEERLGGKLNLETLEIEKPQPEFKDGDIITIIPHIGDKLIYLFKTEDGEKYYGHAYLDGNIAIINEDSYCQKDFNTARPSTEKEKQQLFDALAKDGKQWNAEKKVIEDIKKEYQFKPFEKVLARDSKDSLWHIDLYEGMLRDDDEYNYRCMAADWVYCIPYEGNEHLLDTTKDVEE